MKTYILPTLVLLLFAFSINGQQVDAPTEPVEQPAQELAGLWIGIGPDMKVLPLGTYRFIFVPSDPTKQVETTTVVTGEGSPQPNPPTGGNLAANVKNALSEVNDPNKKKTADGLVEVYQGLINSIDSGSIKDRTLVTTGIKAVHAFTLTGGGWSKYTSVVEKALADSGSAVASSTVLKTVVVELKQL